MESRIEENIVTVQGVINPVPAVIVDPPTSHVPSSSSDREGNPSMEVGVLASVVEKVSRTQIANGKNNKEKEEETIEPGGGFMPPQPSNTGGDYDSDSESSNEINNTTVLATTNEEVSKMVDDVSEGIAKLTTKKKRLSGAQRRKLAKMHRQSIQGKEQDAPKEQSASSTTSSDVGKRYRSPEEQNIAKTPKKKKSSPSSGNTAIPSSTPLNGGSRQHPTSEGGKVDPVTRKASTSMKSSAVDRVSTQSMRKRKLNVEKGKEPPSYAKVARKQHRDDLCYAVIDTSSPSGKIPEDQRQSVEDLVNSKIMEHVLESGEGPPIEIMSCGFRRGVLMLQLASQPCAGTLRKLVDDIPAPWDGASLALVRAKDIPTLTKASIYIKGWGSKFASDAMLKIIGKQNAGLAVGKWEVFHREEGQDGTLLVVGIDPDSMASLTKTKGMAFFVAKAIFIKIGKTPIGMAGDNALPDNEGASDAANTNADSEKTGDPLPKAKEGVNEITNSQEDRLLEDQ